MATERLSMHLIGVANILAGQTEMCDIDTLCFDERLGLMLDR